MHDSLEFMVDNHPTLRVTSRVIFTTKVALLGFSLCFLFEKTCQNGLLRKNTAICPVDCATAWVAYQQSAFTHYGGYSVF